MAVVGLVAPLAARASDRFLVAPAGDVVERSPAYRYANMGVADALAQLDRRKILYQQVDPIGRVRTPIRLTGRLRGVHIHSALPEADRPTTPFELCDVRLALVLDDFSALLARHDIVEVVHYTMYRPSVGPRAMGEAVSGVALPAGQRSAKRGSNKSSARGKKKPNGRGATPRSRGKARPASPPPAGTGRGPIVSRHPDGLAIDVGAFIKRDGTVLSVASHFRGTIGAPTCGPGVAVPQDEHARELRNIVCESFDRKLFTYVLTPNFDAPHQDHFHMEIKPGVRWFLYH